MSEKCKDCGECCLETEMLLSKADIDLILHNSLEKVRREEFTLLNDLGFNQLKNIDGHCVFLDILSRKCRIYDIRPKGCRFYPLIYDDDMKKCMIDKDCPRTHLFYQDGQERELICKQIREFLAVEMKILK